MSRFLSWARVLRAQRKWADHTFGPGLRSKGIVDHIRKELVEIEADPADLEEWVDLIFLAQDGASRLAKQLHGRRGAIEVVKAYRRKLAKNRARNWPDWRTADPDKAIEHVRD